MDTLETRFKNNQSKLLTDREKTMDVIAVGWFDKKTKIVFIKHLDGIQILVGGKKEKSSIILNWGSYGGELGALFEVMPLVTPKSWGDSVKGHLYFKDALKYALKQKEA